MVEHLKNSALPRAFADVVGDLADLVQKEIHLAKAELSEKLSAKLRAGVWMMVAGFMGLLALLMLVAAAALGITAYTGIALQWSCLVVAAALAVLGGVAFAIGRADMREELTPTRTIRQIKQDISTAKEQLT